MTRLNEAPQIILDALTAYKRRYYCATFWSYVCVPFTCGASACDPEGDKGPCSCCYPHPLDSRAQTTLNQLIHKLETQVIIKNSKAFTAIHPELNTEAKIVKWQIEKTLTITNQVLYEEKLHDDYYIGYERPLSNAINEIRSKTTGNPELNQGTEKSSLLNLDFNIMTK